MLDWISVVLLLPFIGVLIQGLPIPPRVLRVLGFAAAFTTWIMIGALIAGLREHPEGISQAWSWIPTLGVKVSLLLDGLSALPLLVINGCASGILMFEIARGRGRRGTVSLLLLLQGALNAVLLSNDLFSLIFFLGLSSVPIYFLLSFHGEDSESVGSRFFVSNGLSLSLLTLLLLFCLAASDGKGLLLTELAQLGLSSRSTTVFGTEMSLGGLGFGLLLSAILIRLPFWPIHGWLPAWSEKGRISVIATYLGLVVPTLFYVLTRVSYQLFPQYVSSVSYGMIVVAVVNMVMGSIMTTQLRSLRQLPAVLGWISSGWALLGWSTVTSSGVTGGVFSIVLVSAAIALISLVIATLEYVEFRPNLPLVVALTLGVLGVIGVPLFGGFIGKIYILAGVHQSAPWINLAVGFSTVVLGWGVFEQFRNFFVLKAEGKVSTETVHPLELASFAPIAVLIVLLGIFPGELLEALRATVDILVRGAHG